MEYPNIRFGEEHLCRLCGKMQTDVIPLCSEDVTLIKYTLGYLNIKFIDNDMLPKWLCATCQRHAESTNKFLIMVEEGQRNLIAQIQDANEECEYTITEISDDKEFIKLETDYLHSPLNSKENLLNNDIFEIREIAEDATNAKTSATVLNTVYIETEGSETIASTMVEKKMSDTVSYCIQTEDYVMNTPTLVENTPHDNPDLDANDTDSQIGAHTEDNSLTSKQLSQNSELNTSTTNPTAAQSLSRCQCTICMKRFNTKYRRSLGQSTERPFACVVCLKRYADITNLRKHQSHKHKGHPELRRDSDLYKFECKICLQRFQYRSFLKRHSFSHAKKTSPSTSATLKSHQKQKKVHKKYTKLRLETVTEEFFSISNSDFLQPEC
ncbi:zinc finger and SCAN domain-containing protein 5B-like isoform X2 [Eurosta solidaginis]|uniref:zinc finger and SCAN domain-containing protein 5B-like isoform X2 n=1 Tax=Eurosta solidaginis TaxID=178769 RepID=UPI003530DC33